MNKVSDPNYGWTNTDLPHQINPAHEMWLTAAMANYPNGTTLIRPSKPGEVLIVRGKMADGDLITENTRGDLVILALGDAIQWWSRK